MWFAPTTTAALLTHVLRGAEEAGFNGLMVALTRNADASAQLTELSEEWTSMHDVTGQLIAVLSPDPDVRTAKFQGTTVSEYAATHDLRFLPGRRRREFEFDRCFVNSVDRDRQRGRPEAVRPRSSQEHRDAWTEAASRCATYFGIAETQIPAVLLLSFAERTAVLIQLRPRSADSLYDLCKQVAADLGYTKHVAELNDRQRKLRRHQQHLHHVIELPDLTRAQLAEWRSRLTDRLGSQMTEKLRAQYDGLDQHLSWVAEVDPALVQQWRARLAELQSHGTVEETYRQLFAIHKHVVATRDRQRWRRLAAKVGKVIAATDRVILHKHTQFWNLDDADPIRAEETEMARREAETDRAATEARQELRQIDDELDSVAAELEAIKPKQGSEPGLADATAAAARHMLGQVDTDTVKGSAGLTGYTVRVVRPTGKTPVERIGNSLSGAVSGSVIQAGHIAGGVHIHHHGLWARIRRRFS